jgi:hypothetical protein
MNANMKLNSNLAPVGIPKSDYISSGSCRGLMYSTMKDTLCHRHKGNLARESVITRSRRGCLIYLDAIPDRFDNISFVAQDLPLTSLG